MILQAKTSLSLTLLYCMSLAWRDLHDTTGVGFVVNVVLIHRVEMGVKLLDPGSILDRRTDIIARFLVVIVASADLL